MADLVTSEHSRGRVSFAGLSFRIAEYAGAASADREGRPIAAASRDGHVRVVRDWDEVVADDAVLTLK